MLKRNRNSVVPWFSGSVVLWFCVLRFCSFHGFCGSVVPWFCSFLVLCSLSFVVLWLHVFMVPWFCDSVVSAVQISMIPYSSSLRSRFHGSSYHKYRIQSSMVPNFSLFSSNINKSMVLWLVLWFYGSFLWLGNFMDTNY